MAKLVKKSLLLCMVLVVLVHGFFLLSAQSPYREVISFWTMSADYPAGEGEVEDYIKKVQKQSGYTKLILGDSVCNQMFNNLQEYNDDYCIVGNNRGLTVAGQYLLLNEFLKSHDKVTDVYLIVGLDTLESSIDITYGYQYVVIPFSRIDALRELDDRTIEQMTDTFGAAFLNRKTVQVIGDSNVARKLYLNYLKKKYENQSVNRSEYGLISDVTVLYLEKMYLLCEENDITMHLLPNPLVDNEYRHKQANLLEEDFKEAGLAEYFPDYFSLIQYFPKEEFVDGIHFGGDYANRESLNEKIQELYLEKGYMEGLHMN